MVWWAVLKKRPCSVCRRWFLPDARVGDRQRACGEAGCQRARHARADRAWHAANRDYDRDRRWRDAIAAAKARPRSTLASSPAPASASAPMTGVPWEVVQDEMRVEGRVILAGVVRVMGLFVQDEMRKQAADIAAQFGRHGRVRAQDEMEASG